LNKVFNYNWTNKIVESNNTTAKVVKYSLIGIALIALAETIANIVALPFKEIANYFKEKNEAKERDAEKRDVEALTAAQIEALIQKEGSWRSFCLGVIAMGAVTGLIFVVSHFAGVENDYLNPING